MLILGIKIPNYVRLMLLTFYILIKIIFGFK